MRTGNQLGSEREHDGRQVGGGVRVGEASADGAHVAHLGIGDGGRGLSEDGGIRLDRLRGDDVVVGDHRADGESTSLSSDIAESADPAEVDEDARLGESQLHHGYQAVTACEDFRVVLVVVQQGESVSECGGCVIVESCCYHLLIGLLIEFIGLTWPHVQSPLDSGLRRSDGIG